MRAFSLLPLLVLVACSEGGGEAPKAKVEAASAMQAGQWEVTSEVTKLTKADEGTPKIDTPAGTKATHSVCLAEADVKKPQPELFVGPGGTCGYDNFYMSRGSLNAQISCTRPGLGGKVVSTAYGDFGGGAFDGNLDTTTYLSSDGDVAITAKLNGRRTGACTAPAAG